MYIGDYINELKAQLLASTDVSRVDANYVKGDEWVRVSVRCAPGCAVAAVTRFVDREVVFRYATFEDGDDLERIVRAMHPTPENIAASEAALREIDELKKRGLL